MAEDWEYKVVKAPMNNPGARARILNREARDGWEPTETTRGPLLSAKDQVTLRRPKAYRAEQKAVAVEKRAEAVAKYEAKTPEQKRNYWIAWGVVALVLVVLALSLG